MKVVLYLMCMYYVFVSLHCLAYQFPIVCMRTLHELIELHFVVSALPCHFGVAMVLQSLVFLVPLGFDHFVLVESI